MWHCLWYVSDFVFSLWCEDIYTSVVLLTHQSKVTRCRPCNIKYYV